METQFLKEITYLCVTEGVFILGSEQLCDKC